MRSTRDYTDLVNDWLTEANSRVKRVFDAVFDEKFEKFLIIK
jgi:hypothetical protein